ncbi:hypothetical protein BDW75DRAFT_230951 [Aspergillus navahoensis]
MVRCDTPYYPRKLRRYDTLQAPKRSVLIGLRACIWTEFAAEGCNVAINYLSSQEQANTLATKLVNEYGITAVTIKGQDCVRVIQTAKARLGGLDIVISNVGWTKVARFEGLHALDEAEWDKCWACNVKSNLYLFREALSTFKSNPEGGIFNATSSIAVRFGPAPEYCWSFANSMLPRLGSLRTKYISLHLLKCLRASQGPMVRINAVVPGLLLTDWGERYSTEEIISWKNKSILKLEVDLDDCADMYVTIAKNTSMIGREILVGKRSPIL